jgi:ferredoxin--NADP+ reductase
MGDHAAGAASAQATDTDLRVAIIGAGPAGFYAALALLESKAETVHVDMFDRLPAPFGLVRYGVAPDHQKIKSVTRVFERGAEAAGSRFRYFGHVELGKDVTLEELRSLYHAVILALGAQSDRHLGVPGEDLPGVYAAREFVAWYNGHPDFAEAQFDLSADTAIVVGIGNVAIDVARILTRTPQELAVTDITDSAQRALAASRIREVVILARRGPLQAACTPVELRELTEMLDADLVVSEADLVLDPFSQAQLDAGEVDSQQRRNLEILRQDARRAPRPDRRIIRLRFYVSPTAILGADRVEGLRLVRNMAQRRDDGRISVVPTTDSQELRCGVVFRSIGYRVTPVPGVPYDEAHSAIPHRGGQVLTAAGGPALLGLFVSGWAKRGPTGVIGTNKPDANETVQALLEARRAGTLPQPSARDVADLLRERAVAFVSFSDWKLLDELEISAGRVYGRPRRKMTEVATMLAALDNAAVESEAAAVPAERPE